MLVGTVSVEKSREAVSGILKHMGVRHEVLNAKNHEREAYIVAQAGRKGAVTIATNMAGRGTDILLGGNPEFMAQEECLKRSWWRRRPGTETVPATSTSTTSRSSDQLPRAQRRLGRGLRRATRPLRRRARRSGRRRRVAHLGTERHESRRIDNQLRGRAGRQGDPGSSRFFLSLQDDLLRLFGGDRIQG